MSVRIERQFLEGGAFVDIVRPKGNKAELTEVTLNELREWSSFYAGRALTQDEHVVIRRVVDERRQLGLRSPKDRFTPILGGFGSVGLEEGAMVEIYGDDPRQSQLIYTILHPAEHRLLKIYPRAIALVTYNLSSL